jgi:hypothetical protein
MRESNKLIIHQFQNILQTRLDLKHYIILINIFKNFQVRAARRAIAIDNTIQGDEEMVHFLFTVFHHPYREVI